MRCRIANGWIEFRSADGSTRRYAATPLRWLLLGLAALMSVQLIKASRLNLYLQRAIVEHDGVMVSTGVKQCLRTLSNHLQTAAAAEHVSRHSQLPSIQLDVPANTLLQMQRALQYGDPVLGHEDGGDQPYFKAIVTVEDQPPQRCKICLRGAMPWHHQPEKPSLRIKIHKQDMTAGDRYVELTRPEDALGVKNWLPMQLAAEIGLMSDQTDHVRLFVNRKYMGVYLRSMRQGEPLALINHRMPGTFFKGDFGGDLWSSLEAWKIAGEMTAEDQAVFSQFLELVQPPTDQKKLEQLRRIFDLEVYARWAALMAVTGSIHADYAHNHSYFFCANQGKIEVIPWDCNSFGVHADPRTPVDTVQHPVIRALICDPSWVHRRNQWIYQLLTDAADAPRLLQRIDEHLNRVKADLKSDRYLGDIRLTHVGWQYVPTSPWQLHSRRRELEDWIRRRQQYLRDYLDDARVAIRQVSDDPPYTVLSLNGHVAVRALPRGDADASDPQLIYPDLSQHERTYLSRPFEEPIEVPWVRPVPRTVRLPCSPDQLQFFNAITGKPIKPIQETVETPPIGAEPRRTLHISEADASIIPEVLLGPGEVCLQDDLQIGPEQRLTIRAGTVLQLGAHVGIYCEGVVTAVGTDDQPIIVQRWHADQPWAAFCVYGPQSKGSVFEHCHIAGGSTGHCDARRFKGMFSAYNCPHITLRHCHFGANVDGDDTVNLAESVFELSDCSWRDALSDALDLDMSQGSIERCRWHDSGNDGLDLMTCQVEVRDCSFEGSGDKGISVGEASRLVAERLTIKRCVRGTELKDASFAQFNNCRFVDNQTAAHAYQKKPYYGRGGSARFVNCTFSGNDLDLFPEKKCRFELVNTEVVLIDGELNNVVRSPVDVGTTNEAEQRVTNLPGVMP